MALTRLMLPCALLLAFGAISAGDDWVEVQSPHFRVVSNRGEKRAREVAREFEQIREVFRTALVQMEQDPRAPILVLAVRNEDSFRELLPQYWERDGPKPAGIFARGMDKHFVVLRVDARRGERYRLIYHEYFHLLLSLNQRRVPVWLDEGLAEFWEQTTINGKRVEMGKPNGHHIALLQRRKMMPLRTLISMEQNPHSTDPDRVSVFYAQSWALTHLLILGDREGAGRTELGNYMALVERGVDATEAFVQAFGDLEALEKRLESYVRKFTMLAFRMDAPEKIDAKTFAAKKLSESQALAFRGNFLMAGARPDAALPLLERALELDPVSTLAHESMGIYHYDKKNLDEAERWLSRAVELDSKSSLCHYYRAQIARSKGAEGEDELSAGLRRAIALNPNFAQAHAELGQLWASTGVRIESAYAMADKAVKLEPDESWYWVNLGQILLRMEKLDEARRASSRALAVARTEESHALVDQLNQNIDRFEVLLSRSTPENMPVLVTDLTKRALHGSDRRIRGELSELRCLADSVYDFVVISEAATLVLRTNAPGTVELISNDSNVTIELQCGAQSSPAIAIYTPSGEPASGVDGELKALQLEP